MTDPPATRLPDVGQGRRAGSPNLTFYEVIRVILRKIHFYKKYRLATHGGQGIWNLRVLSRQKYRFPSEIFSAPVERIARQINRR